MDEFDYASGLVRAQEYVMRAAAQDHLAVERMRPVYDAAMAWRRLRREHDLAPTQLTGVGLELAEGVLEDACDKAEEVERGKA